jgi:hypothetical protein
MTISTGLLPKTTEIVTTLSAGRELASRMPAGAYRAGAGPNCGGSVGTHLRHVLDHYVNFLGGIESGRIDYDVRRRGTIIEQDPLAAIEAIDGICAGLDKMPVVGVSMPLEVRVSADGKRPGHWAASSVLRELDFLLSHTIHHYAIVAMLCGRVGVAVAPNFGMAPATLDYLASLAVREAG